jgi:hypothetical protein
MRGKARIGLVVAVAAAALALGARLTLSRATTSTPRERHPGLELHVPHASAPIPIDAEIEGKKVWEAEAGTTRNLTDRDGKGMVPYTEAKLRWGSGNLYFLLYAGDLDLEGADAFHIEIGGPGGVRVVEVTVLGAVTSASCGASQDPAAPVAIGGGTCDRSWQSRAVVAVDRDGTVGRVGDNDEEWVVEMALPLDALGLANAGPGTRVPFAVRRCEMASDGPKACGSWGMGAQRGEVILDP